MKRVRTCQSIENDRLSCLFDRLSKIAVRKKILHPRDHWRLRIWSGPELTASSLSSVMKLYQTGKTLQEHPSAPKSSLVQAHSWKSNDVQRSSHQRNVLLFCHLHTPNCKTAQFQAYCLPAPYAVGPLLPALRASCTQYRLSGMAQEGAQAESEIKRRPKVLPMRYFSG